MLVIKDVYILINYLSFVESFAMGLSVSGLLWLRYSDPDAHRPIKVHLESNIFSRKVWTSHHCIFSLQMPLILPILFSLICVFLIAVPIVDNIVNNKISETGVALIIVLSGIPVFLIFIYWENKPAWLKKLGGKYIF